MMTEIKASLAKTHPNTDYGLIELRHLGTAAKIIGGVCLVSHIGLIVEIIYKYVKERLENANYNFHLKLLIYANKVLKH